MLDILFHDAHFVAVDKPSGMLVHRTSWCPGERACLDILRDQIAQWVYPVHRIDRATSGVVVFALYPEAAAQLSFLFRERLVEKRYLAVVRGFVNSTGRIDDPLKRSDGQRFHQAVTDFFREATVELHAPIGRYPTGRYSLVRVAPHTGRHHQIRRHFAHVSHPIIGDAKHGDTTHNRFFRDNLGIDRLLLMATDFAFDHPFGGKRVRIHAPLPTDVGHLFARLGWPAEAHPPAVVSGELMYPTEACC